MTPDLRKAFENPLTKLTTASTREAEQQASATKFSQEAVEIPGVTA